MNKDMSCEICDKTISWNMAKASMNRFRKMLCVHCQIEEIKETYPPKLAEYSIKNLEKYL